ncbi:MAG: protein kinase [Candidatus Latescibacterota bacterium]|nr:MAG: protein kinase [Candidatus Latescibacterota bacterium]
MIGQIVSHYKIVERLGEGGMGVVYKAEDLTLDRFVALKFLPRGVDTEEDAKKRFVIEAKSASSLEHPNICTIHEIGETDDGRTFIVMPCYEGETLAEKLRRGSLEMTEAINIVHQVAAGLAKAHEKGIVHRDVKPGNILVTEDGQVKILDFGLAKLSGHSKITKTGATVGTVSYMSPEQAVGKEVDARSDVFSLGVVLFEALTGHPPFPGEREAAILYGIVNQEAPPLSKYKKGIPGDLEQIVEKTLEKDVEKRYQDAGEFKDEIEILSADLAMGKPMRPRRRRRRIRTRRTRVLVFAVVGIIVGVIAVRLLWQYRPLGPSEALALAVVDFRDLATPDDPTVSAGMTGLVHVGLVEASPIRVVSLEYLYDLRRRLFETARGPIEEAQALEVARQSGATMLLAGQMGRIGGASYVTWRLVDVSTGRSVAARRVQGDNQALIADQIIAGVLPLLAEESGAEAPASPPSVTELTTSSPEAYRHYVAGKLALEQGQDNFAKVELERAVWIDSTFALAFFELSRTGHPEIEPETARAYADRAWELRSHLGIKDRMRLEAQLEFLKGNDMTAIETSRELLARWPDDQQVLYDLCLRLFYMWYFDEAAALSGQGLELYPADQVFLNVYGSSLACIGRSDEALKVAHACVRQYPEQPNPWDDLGLHYLEIGLPDSAETAFRKALEIDPDFSSSREGLAYCDYSRGDVDGAVGKLEAILESVDLSESDRIRILTDLSSRPSLTVLHVAAGRIEKALDLFDEAWRSSTGPDTGRELGERAQLYLTIGRPGEALPLARALWEEAEFDYHRFTAKAYEARALVALDSLEAARAVFAEFRALEKESRRPESAMAYNIAAVIALAEGDSEGALDALGNMRRRGVRPGGLDDIQLRENLALAYRMGGQLEEAARVLQELVSVYGGHALAHYRLGHVYEEMGRSVEAKNEYTKFLEKWANADEGLPQLTDARRRLETLHSDRR